MKCNKCKSSNRVKRGVVKGKQRYTCKECGYNYTVEEKSTSKPDSMKRQALVLYLEGLGFRSIGRFFNVSHVSVYYWIKSFGEKIEEIKSDQQIEIVEIDEMHTYIGSKKTIAGSGLLLIEMGKNSSTAFLAIEGLKQEKSFGKK
jgi:transposase